MSGLFGESSAQKQAEAQQAQLSQEQQDALEQQQATEAATRKQVEDQEIAAMRARTGSVSDDDPGAGGVQLPPATPPPGTAAAGAGTFGGFGSSPGNLAAAAIARATADQVNSKEAGNPFASQGSLFDQITGK